MADDADKAKGASFQPSKLVRPTLYIGVGGTGGQVLMRLRRRILAEPWGENRSRIDTITDFPPAHFLHIDLDQRVLTGTDASGDQDPLVKEVKLRPSEKVVEGLDFDNYQHGGRLDFYPHIKDWFPLDRLKDMKIDTSTGAGQIRAVSRLYFYDKFEQIRAATNSHLRELQAGISHQDKLQRLGMETSAERRVVVLASAAGGTGSGAFLDVGYLAKALNLAPTGPVDLILFLPSGYSGANQRATEANSYAALMELDACMSGTTRYVHPRKGWGPGTEDLIPPKDAKPFDSVLLVDTKNMSDQVTNSVSDVYHMVADILFEDFMPGEFAAYKRSVDSNQKRHRMVPYAQSTGDSSGAVELYPRAYSSFGQCTLESPQNTERYRRHLLESQERLKTLFQIMDNPQDCKPSLTETAAYMKEGALRVIPEIDAELEPALTDGHLPARVRDIAIQSNGVQIYPLVHDILGTDNALNHELLDYVKRKFEEILNNDDPEARMIGIQKMRAAIMHEVEIVSGNQDSGRRLRQIEASGRKVEERLLEEVKVGLYQKLDDRKRGGLDYVTALIQSVQGSLTNDKTGIVPALEQLAVTYTEIINVTLGEEGFSGAAERLGQTRTGGLFGSKKKAGLIAEEMQKYLYWALRMKLLLKGTLELARIYNSVAVNLGQPIGTDEDGNEEYNGLLGEFMTGRSDVRATMDALAIWIRRIDAQRNESYAMKLTLEVPEDNSSSEANQEAVTDWAEHVFGVTGSPEIFPKLRDEDSRYRFINVMLDHAERKDKDQPNVRISDILRKKSGSVRGEMLRHLLGRAMPWVSLSKERLSSDNYVVLASSGDPAFGASFGEEIKQSLPNGGISGDGVYFPPLSTRSELGKALCFVQVDGFPLDNLRDLKRWRASYRQEIERLPVHTSKLARYRHPIIPTPDERRDLRTSLQVFYAAIVLGVLERDPDSGTYMGTFSGTRLGCGTEINRRNDPFEDERRGQLEQQVRQRLDALKSRAQREATLVLLQYYLKGVYPKKPKGDGGGNDREVVGQAHVICSELQRQWANQWGLSSFIESLSGEEFNVLGDPIGPIKEKFMIDRWVSYLQGSIDESDPNEINDQIRQDKCKLRSEVYGETWLEKNVPCFANHVPVSGAFEPQNGAAGQPPAVGGAHHGYATMGGFQAPAPQQFVQGQPFGAAPSQGAYPGAAPMSGWIVWYAGQDGRPVPYWAMPGMQPMPLPPAGLPQAGGYPLYFADPYGQPAMFWQMPGAIPYPVLNGAAGGAPMGGMPMGGMPMGGAPMGGAPMGGAPMGGAPMGSPQGWPSQMPDAGGSGHDPVPNGGIDGSGRQ